MGRHLSTDTVEFASLVTFAVTSDVPDCDHDLMPIFPELDSLIDDLAADLVQPIPDLAAFNVSELFDFLELLFSPKPCPQPAKVASNPTNLTAIELGQARAVANRHRRGNILLAQVDGQDHRGAFGHGQLDFFLDRDQKIPFPATPDEFSLPQAQFQQRLVGWRDGDRDPYPTPNSANWDPEPPRAELGWLTVDLDCVSAEDHGVFSGLKVTVAFALNPPTEALSLLSGGGVKLGGLFLQSSLEVFVFTGNQRSLAAGQSDDLGSDCLSRLHLDLGLGLNVLFNDLTGDVPGCRYKIASSPQRWKLLQDGEFFPENSRGSAFDPSNDLMGRDFGVSRDEEVEVIGTDLHCQHPKATFLGHLKDDLFQPLLDPPAQNELAPLGTPDQVVVDQIDLVLAMLIVHSVDNDSTIDKACQVEGKPIHPGAFSAYSVKW